jgi:hypothetical protein
MRIKGGAVSLIWGHVSPVGSRRINLRYAMSRRIPFRQSCSVKSDRLRLRRVLLSPVSRVLSCRARFCLVGLSPVESSQSCQVLSGLAKPCRVTFLRVSRIQSGLVPSCPVSSDYVPSCRVSPVRSVPVLSRRVELGPDESSHILSVLSSLAGSRCATASYIRSRCVSLVEPCRVTLYRVMPRWIVFRQLYRARSRPVELGHAVSVSSCRVVSTYVLLRRIWSCYASSVMSNPVLPNWTWSFRAQSVPLCRVRASHTKSCHALPCSAESRRVSLVMLCRVMSNLIASHRVALSQSRLAESHHAEPR